MLTLNLNKIIAVALTTFLSTCSIGLAQITNPVRNVQIRTVDLVTQSIEIHNFGTTDQPLDGWRMCTHDESAVRRYSSAGGFNFRTLGAGESIFLMYNNDAVALNEFNISSLGNFAEPLDAQGAYSIQFYFQTPFGVGDNIADHLQFSLDGSDDAIADERSDEAVAGGVWTAEDSWIPVTAESTIITLVAGAENSEENSPANYEVGTPVVIPPVDPPTPPNGPIQLVNGVLIVRATQGPDDIQVVQSGAQVDVSIDGDAGVSFPLDSVDSVEVFAFGGADTINTDVNIPTFISAGSGADTITGGTNTNEIFGGPGADTIFGGPLDDFINSGRGQDFVNSMAGNDTVEGGDATDTIFAGPGDDTVIAGLGADIVNGGGGDDILCGNAGADTLNGGPGNDTLTGVGGPDELNGGGGDDILSGGEAFDILDGSAGFDIAVDVGEVEISIEIRIGL